MLKMLVLCAVLTAVGVASSQTKPADEIRSVRHASNEALKRHDIQAFGASLTDDFVAVAGSGAAIPSRQDYIDRLTKDFADSKSFRYERIVDSVDLSEATLAAEHGHWIGFAPDGTRAIGGTYLAMWRRTDAGWKIRSELFVLLKCYDASACERYRKR